MEWLWLSDALALLDAGEGPGGDSFAGVVGVEESVELEEPLPEVELDVAELPEPLRDPWSVV